VNQTGQTLITAGSTLLAVVITFVGSYVLQRRQARKESESRRREAVAELLATATDLINGLISLRAAYARRAGWRYWLRPLAVLWPDIRELTRWQDLTDPNKLAPVIGSAVQIHREQLDDQRRAALDVSAVVTVSMRPDRRLFSDDTQAAAIDTVRQILQFCAAERARAARPDSLFGRLRSRRPGG
jgi:hypothetical protein